MNHQKKINRRLWLSGTKPNSKVCCNDTFLASYLSPTYRNHCSGSHPPSLNVKGFTLIEMVVAIVLLGIVGSIASVFIGNSMEAYSGLTRRDGLQSTARMAVERISRELRMALPNSVCTHNGVSCDNSGTTLYLLRTKDAGEYQDRGGLYYPGQSRDRLPIAGNTSNQFDVLSSNTLNASANDWVVVYNTDNADIYSTTTRRKQISSITTKDVDNVAPANDISVINLTAVTSFPTHSPGRRFMIIENNATLFYLTGTDLYRARSTFGAPTTPVAGSENLLLENVSSLNFTYLPGSLHRSGLLRINITVTQSGESIQLVHEAQVYNAP